MEQRENDTPYRYDAFISYRHTYPDIQVAERLHRLLETYRTPKYLVRRGNRKGLSRVFRDREELPTSSDLGSDIETALRQSWYLIVICSTHTPESMWVNGEIERFRELHGDDRILALLIEGEPGHSFPKGLMGVKRLSVENNGADSWIDKQTEPLAADIRGKSLRESLKRLKTEKLRLLAPILGCRYDELKQRNRERQIRRWSLVSSSLTLFFFLFGMFTLYQLKLVRESEGVALANEKAARASEQKAKQSESAVLARMSAQLLADGNRLEAIRLALNALPKDMAKPDRPYVSEAELALSNAYYNNPYQGRLLLKGHKETVQHMAFSSDGKWIATASDDNSVRVWDCLSGRLLSVLEDHAGPVIHCCFSPDSRRLLTTSLDGTVRIWQPNTGKEMLIIRNMESPYQSSYSPDGKQIFINSGNSYQIRDAESGKELYRFVNTPERLMDFIDSENGIALVWNQTENGDERKTAEKYQVMKIPGGTVLCSLDPGDRLVGGAFDPNGACFASISRVNGAVSLWNLKNGSRVFELDTGGEKITGLSFSPDGKSLLAETLQNNMLAWDTSTGKLAGKQEECRISANRAAEWMSDTDSILVNDDPLATRKPVSYSPDGKRLVLYHTDDTVTVTDLVKEDTSKLVFDPLNGYKAIPQYVIFSPDGNYIAVSYDDFSVGLFDVQPCDAGTITDEVRYYVMSPASSMLTGDAKKVLSCGKGTVTVREIPSGKPLSKLNLSGEYLGNAVFSPNEEIIAGTWDDNKVFLWDAKTGRKLAELPGHDSRAVCLVFDRDSRRLATGTEKGTVLVWNTTDGTLLRKFTACTQQVKDMEFSPDGGQLAISSFDNSAHVWDLGTGKELAKVLYAEDGTLSEPDSAFGGMFLFNYHNVEYSMDGKKLICFAASDSKVHVLDAQTGSELYSIQSTSSFKGAVFSPDSLHIATLGINNSIVIRDASSGKQELGLGSRSSSGHILRYSHDGKRIMAAYSDGVRLYDSGTGEELAYFKVRPYVTEGLFSKDDRKIAVFSMDWKVRTWDLTLTAQELINKASRYLETCGY